MPKCHVMPILVDTSLKIKKLQPSGTTGCGNLVWDSGTGIETPSCNWSIVRWNTALERVGILKKFCEMSFINVEIEGQMIIIRRLWNFL